MAQNIDTDIARLHAKLDLGPQHVYRDFHAGKRFEPALQRWPLVAKLLGAKQYLDARAAKAKSCDE